VNTFQTVLFLCFGAAALLLIGSGLGGFERAVEQLRNSPALAPLLTRERVPPLFFLSYTFIPLSSIAFPHIAIFCLTARHMSQFKRTVIFYPLCILAIWLPCVFLGVMANSVSDVPQIQDKIEARQTLAAEGPRLSPEERGALRARMAADDITLLLLGRYAPLWLAGLLGAGIMAAVMASDSQILALSTMFTEDVFAFYGGKLRFGETVQVNTGRLFVVLVTVFAYVVALQYPASIFDLAVQYAFSGYAAMSPLLFAALFWKRSTKWGALAVTVWVVVAVAGVALFQSAVPPPNGPPAVIWQVGSLDLIARTANGTAILGLMPVVPMTLISMLLMGLISLGTRPPSTKTVERYVE
jgi:SSS family solute:Na+ symporter